MAISGAYSKGSRAARSSIPNKYEKGFPVLERPCTTHVKFEIKGNCKLHRPMVNKSL